MLRQDVLIEKKIARKRDRNMQQDANYQSRSNLTLTDWLTECNINTNLGGRDDYVDWIYWWRRLCLKKIVFEQEEKKIEKDNKTTKSNRDKVTICLFLSAWKLLERHVSKEIHSSSSSGFIGQLWNFPPTISSVAKWGIPYMHIFGKDTHCLLSNTRFCMEKTKMIFNPNRTKVVSRPSIMRFI